MGTTPTMADAKAFEWLCEELERTSISGTGLTWKKIFFFHFSQVFELATDNPLELDILIKIN